MNIENKSIYNYLAYNEFKEMCGNKNIIALDIGKKKVGVAIGSILVGVATPLKIIHYNSLIHLSILLKEVIAQYDVAAMVIGIANSEDLKDLTSFIEQLNLALPYFFEDERNTTKIANSLLSDIGLKRKRRNKIDDKVAAQIILERFFYNALV